MHIHTIDENYEYRMKNILRNFVRQYKELQDLESEELEDKIWVDYAEEFGQAVLEDMINFSGDELFEL